MLWKSGYNGLKIGINPALSVIEQVVLNDLVSWSLGLFSVDDLDADIATRSFMNDLGL